MSSGRFNPLIPAELRSRPPRQTQLREGRGPRVMGIRVFMLPHLLIGFVALVIVIGEPIWLWTYPPVLARVTTMQRTVNAKGQDRDRITYDYPWRGQRISDSARVSADAYQKLQSSQTVKVHALGIGGHIFSELDVTPGQYTASRWFLWPWALAWNGMLFFMLRQPLQARRLVRDGEPVVGKIVNKKAYGGKSARYRVSYEYSPPAGGARQGGMTVARADFDSASTGKEVTVLYDPNCPGSAAVYEYGDYRAV
jgi:hypothetical protein